MSIRQIGLKNFNAIVLQYIGLITPLLKLYDNPKGQTNRVKIEQKFSKTRK